MLYMLFLLNIIQIVRFLSGLETNQVKKKAITVFNDCGLKITIKAVFYVVKFLDITLDLRNNTYESYRKPDKHHIYVHKSSNHPKTILSQLPKTTNKRLSDLSYVKEIFQGETPIYSELLKNSVFNEPLVLHQRKMPAIIPPKAMETRSNFV